MEIIENICINSAKFLEKRILVSLQPSWHVNLSLILLERIGQQCLKNKNSFLTIESYSVL